MVFVYQRHGMLISGEVEPCILEVKDKGRGNIFFTGYTSSNISSKSCRKRRRIFYVEKN
jgi:hypothetical protein